MPTRDCCFCPDEPVRMVPGCECDTDPVPTCLKAVFSGTSHEHILTPKAGSNKSCGKLEPPNSCYEIVTVDYSTAASCAKIGIRVTYKKSTNHTYWWQWLK